MKNFSLKFASLLVAFVALLNTGNQVAAATINAASCSQGDVQSAINSAANGDVVLVPPGNCTWNSLSISKGIHLKGAGVGSSNITLAGSGTLSANANGSLEISGFRFIKSGSAIAWYIYGSQNGKVALFHDNQINLLSGYFLQWSSNNGVFYRNTANCTGGSEIVIRHVVEPYASAMASWTSPDTIGSRDSNGINNLYIEDNVFNNCTAGAFDMDNGSRSVIRYNVFNMSSYNSHGFATSPVGSRHFEIYNNQFNYSDANVNQNWQIWVRGGTGVVFNNHIQDIRGQMWGNKTEVLLTVRAASDGGGQYPGGCCTTWPCIRQLGQNHDGSRQFTDPIRFWNNSGSYAVAANQSWGTCGGPANEFIQNGRDYLMDSPRPNYTPYTYPHPLTAGSGGAPPASVPPGVCP